MTRFSAIILATIMCCAVLPSPAQEKKASEAVQEDVTGATEKPAEAPAQLAAPYDDKLLRLSEVLGAIHYLRTLCGAGEGNKWRDQMGNIIASEQPEKAREARLIARFNRGYRAFDQTYGKCTSSALTAADRYMKEGVLLSSQITSRYGR